MKTNYSKFINILHIYIKNLFYFKTLALFYVPFLLVRIAMYIKIHYMYLFRAKLTRNNSKTNRVSSF